MAPSTWGIPAEVVAVVRGSQRPTETWRSAPGQRSHAVPVGVLAETAERQKIPVLWFKPQRSASPSSGSIRCNVESFGRPEKGGLQMQPVGTTRGTDQMFDHPDARAHV
ncbi:MAG: hypothetical protein ACOC7S_00045 [Planctomycetota bacterium]